MIRIFLLVLMAFWLSSIPTFAQQESIVAPLRSESGNGDILDPKVAEKLDQSEIALINQLNRRIKTFRHLAAWKKNLGEAKQDEQLSINHLADLYIHYKELLSQSHKFILGNDTETTLSVKRFGQGELKLKKMRLQGRLVGTMDALERLVDREGLDEIDRKLGSPLPDLEKLADPHFVPPISSIETK